MTGPHGGYAHHDVTISFESTNSGKVLETLARSVGPIPRVLLPDTHADDHGVPVINPSSAEMPGAGERGERYQFFGEIARGGMGAVLKGRDPDLGRELAVKVLLESHKDNPDLVRRFVEEAQIGGQLQHPGIVPIYELGTFADRRPFFSMKLVKGRTLSSLLAERSDPGRDLSRFLAIFESVCQTMAYAHARGVIHRDLKPSNIMVGSFGEVQVMDWGLAKVMPKGGAADDYSAGKVEESNTVIATARGESDSEQSRAGSVLGTPSYMAPEQARGEIDRLDERCDVFALGSILCEVLTAQPAFTGRSSGEIQRKASRGDLHDALARVRLSHADPELIALAISCLAPERDDRPRSAGVVSALIMDYQNNVRERLKAAEHGRVEAAARAEEEQKRRVIADRLAVEERAKRRLTVGLAASLVLLGTVAGLSLTFWAQQRAMRAAAVARVLGESATLRNLAVAAPDEPARWQTAVAAIKQAEGVAVNDRKAASQLSALRREVEAGAAAAERDRVLLERLVDIRSTRAEDSDDSNLDAAYEEAFRTAGYDLKTQPAEAAGRRALARPRAVAQALAAAIDELAADRRDSGDDRADATRLFEVARVADPDPWRNDLRTSLLEHDKAKLLALAKSARLDELGPISLHALGRALLRAEFQSEAEDVLAQGPAALSR